MITAFDILQLPATLLLLAMVIDALSGEPALLYNRVPHPAVLLGKLVQVLDERLNRPHDRQAFADNIMRFRGICATATRPIQWMHLAVPRDRDDDAYFVPLANLDIPSETELLLGLVHHTDGVDGTQRRVAAAKKVVSEFGIATECGFGRRDPDTIPRLLDIHAQVADG